MLVRNLLILIILTCSLPFEAQEYLTNVRHFSEEEGWETRDFRMAFKDSQGFLWFTSEIGAYRYDGYKFKSFKRKTDKNEILEMNRGGEDSENNIWFDHPLSITNDFDISILPFDSDSLVRFDDYFKSKSPFLSKNIINIYFGKNNLIWIILDNGKIYEYKNKIFKEIFQHPISSTPQHFRITLSYLRIIKSQEDNYWIKSQNEIIQVSHNEIISRQPILTEDVFQLPINDSLCLFGTKKAPLLFAQMKNSDAKNLESFLGSSKNIAIIPDRFISNPNYFLTSKSRTIYDLEFIDLEENKIINIEPFGIPNKNISYRSFFAENKNSIWLMTHDGIYQVQLSKKRFNNYLPGTTTRKMVLDENGFLWVNSNSGFYKINYKNKTVQSKTPTKWKYGRGLFLENQNELWMGKRHGVITKINPSKFEVIKEYDLRNLKSTPYHITSFLRDKKTNQLWVGSTNGILKYDPENDRFYPFVKKNEFKEFEENSFYHFFENEEFILLASTKGIFQLDPEKGIVAHFSTKDGILPNDNIVFIHQDKVDQTFWLGTKWNGLIHWDKRNGTTEVFNTENGLSDNLIYAVYEDDAGNLWLPSNHGVMRFDKKTAEVSTFTTRDGIPYNEFNYHSHHQDKEGNLFFGGLNGITHFHPKDFPTSRENPPLRLVDVEILDESTLRMTSQLNSFLKNKKVIISPSNNSFRLTFALLDFKQPEDNRFQYKIEGKENSWNKVEGNTLQLNNLPYGDFSILVKGQNSNGNWSNKELKIPIQILRPYYLKSGFYWLVGLTLAGLIWIIIRRRTAILRKEKEKLEKIVANRTQEIQKQAEELKKLDEIKTRFFANVTHELRTPLTLIIGPLKQLMKSEKLDDETMRTLTAISQNSDQLKNLVEEILDLSRYDANKLELNKKPVHFLSEVKKWATGFDLEAQHRGINFQIYYQLPIDLQLIIDTRKLKKIATNLLSNAFKHSKNGDSITLEVMEKNEKINLKVIDTGDGIHPSDLPFIFDRFYQSKQTDTQLQGGLGIGLALSKELSKLMDGNISVTSAFGKGSTFVLEFPKEKVPTEIIQKGNMLEKRRITPVELFSKNSKDVDYNILIVEDNAQMQAFVQQLLHPISNTFLASNGKDALHFLENTTNEIHLIISDVMMPEMDGFTLLQRLKLDEKWQLIPVIMLTARGDIADKLNAIRIGVDDYLVKPFEPDELIARVNNLFQNIELRKNVPVSTTYEFNEAELPTLESADLKWLKSLEKIAFDNITQPNFNVTQLAFEMTIGDRQLNRKLKKLTGLTPGNYLKEIKLQKARQLLENKAYSTVAEISYLVGFSTPDYFSKIYKNRFGKLPSEYLE